MPIINLLPPALREQQRYARRNQYLVSLGLTLLVTTIVIILAFGLQFGLLGLSADSNSKALAESTKSLDSYQALEGTIKTQSAKLARFQLFRTKHPAWDHLISEIATRVPSGLFLINISTTPPPAQSLTIDGLAGNLDQISSFVASLKHSTRLQTIKLDDVTTSGNPSYRYQFHLEASLTPQALR